jgi:hypothetical protein
MLSRSLIGIFRFFGSVDALLVTTSRCFLERVKIWGGIPYPTRVLSLCPSQGGVTVSETFDMARFQPIFYFPFVGFWLWNDMIRGGCHQRTLKTKYSKVSGGRLFKFHLIPIRD